MFLLWDAGGMWRRTQKAAIQKVISDTLTYLIRPNVHVENLNAQIFNSVSTWDENFRSSELLLLNIHGGTDYL